MVRKLGCSFRCQLTWPGGGAARRMSDATFRENHEIAWSWVALVATLAAITVAVVYFVGIALWGGSPHRFAEILGFLIAAPLLYGNLVYQLSRLGAVKRERAHRPADGPELESVYRGNAP